MKMLCFFGGLGVTKEKMSFNVFFNECVGKDVREKYFFSVIALFHIIFKGN